MVDNVSCPSVAVKLVGFVDNAICTWPGNQRGEVILPRLFQTFLNIVSIRFRWKLNSFVYVTIYVLEHIWLQCQIFWPVRKLKWRQAWDRILSLRNDHLREQAPLPVELVNPKARLQLVTKNAPQIGNFRFIDFHDLIHHFMLTGTFSLVCPTAMCSKRATSS